jgi:hypothetical protein
VADELPELTVPDAADWRAMLGEHHPEPGVWLVLAAEVDLARADGRWDAGYPGQATAAVPADAAGALAANRSALAMVKILPSKNRYAIRHRLGQAKRPETRARRLAESVGMLARGETIYPQRRGRRGMAGDAHRGPSDG